MIQWLLGREIVSVLVPFTKPQPKKATHKTPERKRASSLWLGPNGRLQWAQKGWEGTWVPVPMQAAAA